MPKATYFRLPAEKRHRLMDAAVQEFTRAPFAKASVSNIIQTAGIPRGSFYQYFEDKQDIFFFMLQDLGKDLGKGLLEHLETAHGDLIAGLRDFMDDLLDQVVTGTHADLFRNVFVYMDYHSAARTMYGDAKPDHHDKKKLAMSKLLPLIDHDKITIDNDHDIIMLIRVAFTWFMQVLAGYYSAKNTDHEVPIDDVKTSVATVLDWLEHGVAK
ncbi:TetR/AcrR family transcriptional regulator [Lacticaseibacillus pabuli]|uniref:TetR/AcrR family transcriptional regulator n=1 Tax=Lacticaseibacillus pabuli TaxID=3025672 RepID=A0ABY7WNK9_9LACO|nr:TetR/AcrR family transcriptional regulator [Lacticaseibacillus sp. KACC 23028]WDF81780.1 TetR/AcrR family transcriptional regulator [Lacticaseibacillus sp. KACC 23028]